VLHQREQAVLGHVGDRLVVRAALTEERVGAAFDGVGLEVPFHSQAFTCGAQQRQQRTGQGTEQQPVPALRLGDTDPRQAHAKPQVLEVSHPLSDREAVAVERYHFGGRGLFQSGGQTPRLLHSLLFLAHHRADRRAVCGDQSFGQFAQVACLGHPLCRRAALPLRIRDGDALAEANHLVKAHLQQQRIEFLVSKATVGQDRHLHLGGDELPQLQHHRILYFVAQALERRLLHRPSHRGRGPSMLRYQRSHQRGLVVWLEVGPVQCHQRLGALPQYVRYPQGQYLPHGNARVEQQTVHLLHPMRALRALRQGHSLTDGVDRQTGRVDDTQGCERQRQDSLRIEFLPEQALEEGMALLLVDGR
jgi:hypothetical protein